MMTQRERLLAPFRGLVANPPAWTADLTYWHDATAQRGQLDARYRGPDGLRRLHQDLGVCNYYNYGESPYNGRYADVEYHQEEKDGVRRRYWRTPEGTLTDQWRFLTEACCWAHEEYAVKELSDFKPLVFLYEHFRCEPNHEAWARADEAIGDEGVKLTAMPRSPLPALLADWCGVEKTIYFLMDAPDATAEILAIIDQANDEAVAMALASSAILFHFCDNLDSSASTSFFETYMKDYYERRLAQVHQAGKYAVVHLDGRVRGLLPKLAACGFDGVESITPAPVGDVRVEEARALAGNDRLILWGGVPGAMFASPWTEKDVREHTRRVVQAWRKDGRLVVGSADQVPPDGRIEFCRAIAETVAEA